MTMGPESSRLLGYTLLLGVLIAPTTALVLQNITLPLPVGTTNHNTPGLICTPTEWTDLAGFYLFNYVAHAATVLTRPGERALDFASTVFGSLLFPALGLYRGVEAIFSGAVFCRDDLRKAARSAALCCVARTADWRPQNGDRIGNAVYKRGDQVGDEKGEEEKKIQQDDRSIHLITYEPPWFLSKFGCPVYVHRQIIHGTCSLPEGYCFIIAPPDVQFDMTSSKPSLTEIASTYNIVKALVAIIQTGYASLTLYRARGDQVKQFGFAAFGLTVAPYAVMSMVNLIGNLCRPDYACLYMVESSIMDEARARGGVFDGSVARLEEDIDHNVQPSPACSAEQIEDLQFYNEGENAQYAHFSTTNPPKQQKSKALEKSPTFNSLTSSTREKIYQISPLPERMDYTDTSASALLLIPACNPLRKVTRPTPTEQPNPSTPPTTTTYALNSLTLQKPNCFAKRKTWSINFPPHPSHPLNRLLKYLLTALISLIPFLINGLMSHFHRGGEEVSDTWRVYTIQWLVFGVWTGLCWVWDHEVKDASQKPLGWFGWKGRAFLYFTSSSPAIGGLIVVGQMMMGWGDCTWVGG